MKIIINIKKSSAKNQLSPENVNLKMDGMGYLVI